MFAKSPWSINLLTSEIKISKEYSGVTLNQLHKPVRSAFPIVWMERRIHLAEGQTGVRLMIEACGQAPEVGGGRGGEEGSRHISPHRPLLCPWEGLSAS